MYELNHFCLGAHFAVCGLLGEYRIKKTDNNAYYANSLGSLEMQDVALFKEGFPANDAIKLMAENGDNSALLVRFLPFDNSVGKMTDSDASCKTCFFVREQRLLPSSFGSYVSPILSCHCTPYHLRSGSR